MTHSKQFLQKAEHCATIALGADNEAARRNYMRAAQCWQRLADLDEWLDRQVSPFVRKPIPAKASARR